MYEITELPSATPVSSAGRLFFCMYYLNTATDADASFQRAAKTWIRETKTQFSFREGVDIFLEQSVTTEKQFKSAWNGIAQQASYNGMKVSVGQLLTHATKDATGQDGLEFKPVAGDGTLTQTDIAGLAKMPWSSDGALILAGCNTGLTGDGRTWTPAGEFAKGQKVRTLGQAGYAYFSKVWSSYTTQAKTDPNIALWAYKRGKNATVGDGSRLKGVLVQP
ncbi:MAG TPA: hypothetical protein VFX59_15860 [Polyangiales bacterium]|nr:hypothetical protein [Polyangiales bacterium]